MANYLANDVVDILLVLGECHRNYRNASQLYRQRYPDRRHPGPQQIINIERRSRSNALHRHRRQNRVLNNNDPRLLAILGMIHINPHISLRQIERELGIPRATAHRLLQLVRYHPYHITLVQELNDNDCILRVNFCTWALNELDQDPDFFWSVCFCDEATFHSNGSLNRHNSHYWSPVNPHWYREVLNQHRWSLHVWAGIVNGSMIGPHFFERTINGMMYLDFLQNHLPGYLEDIPLDVRQRMWFQQDGAPAHHAGIVTTFLRQKYHERLIIRNGPVPWPPRSPDLNPLDSYFWGFAKDAVYQEAPTTRENMMQRIIEACQSVTQETLQRVMRNFRRRLTLCLENQGGHFEHLIPRGNANDD